MTASAALITRAWRVGSRTVTLSVPKPDGARPVCMSVEWAPNLPRKLSAEEWKQYRAGRDAALAELAKQLGGAVGLIEL